MPDKRRLVTSKFPFITQQLVSWKRSYRKRALNRQRAIDLCRLDFHPPAPPPRVCAVSLK